MSTKLIARPPAFSYSKIKGTTTLHCDEVSIPKLAEKFGTPLYVYSASTIKSRFHAFDRAFAKHPHTVCFAMKANSNLSILKTLAKLGSGFDIVSGGELQRILRVSKQAARRVVYSGVGKSAAEMDLALKSDILFFNCESAAEMRLLAQRAAKLKKTARISFRVNPDVKASTHPYISTGMKEHKFGVPIDEAREIYAEAAQYEWLEPVGVSAHIGSQITEVAPFAETVERLYKLVRQLMSDGLNIRYLDAGGGFGIDYRGNSNAGFSRQIKEYADAVLKMLGGSDIHLILEPGRAIVAPAGVLVTSALYAKRNGKKQFLIVDGAMNDLIRPSLYGAHHEIIPVTPRNKKEQRADATTSGSVDIVGPICETGDFFGRERELPGVGPGDLVAVLDAGAYGMTLSSNYNTRPRAAEVMIEGKRVTQIRRRETIEDLIRAEL